MKDEYDFSSGIRGKFFHPDAEFNLPVYLKPNIAEAMSRVAEEKNTDVGELVNDFLEKNLKVIQSG